MNVLFLTLSKINSINQSGLYPDLLREFRDNEHNIYVVSPLERREKKANYLIEEHQSKIVRVNIGNTTKTNFIEKGISTLLLDNIYKRAIKKHLGDVKIDLILYSTPPITFYNSIKYVKTRDQAKTYLLLKDIFPQNAVDIGLFNKKSLLYKYFRNKEKKLYAISDFIGTMSKANSRYVIGNTPELAGKVEEAPNSIDPIEVNKQKDYSLLKKYSIPPDKLLAVYGGNLGKPQGIDFLIDCLKRNESNEGIFIIIAGSGTEYNKLNKYFNDFKPQNSILLSQLPKEEYEQLILSFDVGLIFLDYRFTIPNFPSRLLSYMQAGMPVISATDPNTDIGDVIEKGNFGIKVLSNDVESFNNSLLKLKDIELRSAMGDNAKVYLKKHYTSNTTYEIIMKHFK